MIQNTIFFSLLALFSGIALRPANAQLTMPIVDSSTIETMVRETFPHSPEMVDIARCESGIRQHRNDGSVLRGGSGGNYIGIFQISEGHAATAKGLGLDIYTAEGNIAYAKYLYDRQGMKPWAPCAKPTSTTNTTPPSPISTAALNKNSPPFSANLKIGMSGTQVLNLQKALNAAGFVVAMSGPGSPGNETATFGSLTREAVKRFQCSKGITCSGTESTTGYGYVGPRTRAALLSTAP